MKLKTMNKIEKIKAEIERRRLHFNKEAEKYQALNNGYSQNCYGARDALRDLENFLDTLPEEKPIEKDEEMEALIACDIMEATVKRVIIDKQDKDKEEEAMLEKINYLRNLGLNE